MSILPAFSNCDTLNLCFKISRTALFVIVDLRLSNVLTLDLRMVTFSKSLA